MPEKVGHLGTRNGDLVRVVVIVTNDASRHFASAAAD
jgi:hypothetical protein